ncbi:MAG: hypothetical protein HY860_05060 [Chlamydiales bacterium]|nr:hypothetical protein [Chlamydiales bacterium]
MIKWMVVVFMVSMTITAIAKEKKQQMEKPPTIKVLLKKDVEGSLVEVKGSYKIYNPSNHRLLSIGFQGKRFAMLPQSDGLKWGEGFPSVYQIQIIPSSLDTSILVDGIEYRGCLEAYQIGNKISLLNEVDIENYVSSVMTSNFGFKKLSPTVLECLAIIFRTNAYYTSLKNQDVYWQVAAKDVQYGGYATTLVDFDIETAINKTRNLTMTYKDSPFPCTFTANCAGITAAYGSIFKKQVATPIGVESLLAKKEREHVKWEFVLDAPHFSELCNIKPITQIDLFVDSSSKKAYAIRIKNKTKHKDFTFDEIQQLLGKSKLKSNDFTVRLIDNQIHFEGYGEGLGIGLCLFSAEKLAKNGSTAQEILSDFFPLTYLQKISNFEKYHHIIK